MCPKSIHTKWNGIAFVLSFYPLDLKLNFEINDDVVVAKEGRKAGVKAKFVNDQHSNTYREERGDK